MASRKKEILILKKAFKKLGQSRNPRAVEPLVDATLALQFDEYLNTLAGETIRDINDPRAVELLMRALQNKDRRVRCNAIITLGYIGDPRAVDLLVASLQDKEESVREESAIALGKIGDARAEEPLLAALKDKAVYVRRRAAIALGKIGDPHAAEPLLALLEDEDGGVVEDVEETLKKLGAAKTLADYQARQKSRPNACPRCGKTLSAESASKYVTGRVCSCGWAAIWCHHCGRSPMQATREDWNKPGMPLQAWLECKACGKSSRADYDIIQWLLRHRAL